MFWSRTLFLLSILTALLSSSFYSKKLPIDDSSRILLLTAHPDDECMFFAPTILGLLAQGHTGTSSKEVFSLCLSTGNADGLGEIRKKELERSLDVLGIVPEKRWTIDHPKLKDNFTAIWDSNIISNVVRPYIIDNDIDIVLTFDFEGISSHPNHKSLPEGTMHLFNTLQREGREVPVLYTLVTVPLFAKYTSVFAVLLIKLKFILLHIVDLIINFSQRTGFLDVSLPKAALHRFEVGSALVFSSGIRGYLQALQAMRMHESQLVWFRWLYVVFSRYMWVNEWVEVRIQ